MHEEHRKFQFQYQEEAITNEASEDFNINNASPIAPAPIEGEDEFLRSPETPKSTVTPDDALRQLSVLRMKRTNLTIASKPAYSGISILTPHEAAYQGS